MHDVLKARHQRVLNTVNARSRRDPSTSLWETMRSEAEGKAADEPILGSYMRQGMRFFLARVNLKEQARLGFSYLRPIQVAFESPKFMLPIRLGTLNADGDQELFVLHPDSGARPGMRVT